MGTRGSAKGKKKRWISFDQFQNKNKTPVRSKQASKSKSSYSDKADGATRALQKHMKYKTAFNNDDDKKAYEKGYTAGYLGNPLPPDDNSVGASPSYNNGYKAGDAEKLAYRMFYQYRNDPKVAFKYIEKDENYTTFERGFIDGHQHEQTVDGDNLQKNEWYDKGHKAGERIRRDSDKKWQMVQENHQQIQKKKQLKIYNKVLNNDQSVDREDKRMYVKEGIQLAKLDQAALTNVDSCYLHVVGTRTVIRVAQTVVGKTPVDNVYRLQTGELVYTPTDTAVQDETPEGTTEQTASPEGTAKQKAPADGMAGQKKTSVQDVYVCTPEWTQQYEDPLDDDIQQQENKEADNGGRVMVYVHNALIQYKRRGEESDGALDPLKVTPLFVYQGVNILKKFVKWVQCSKNIGTRYCTPHELTGLLALFASRYLLMNVAYQKQESEQNSSKRSGYELVSQTPFKDPSTFRDVLERARLSKGCPVQKVFYTPMRQYDGKRALQTAEQVQKYVNTLTPKTPWVVFDLFTNPPWVVRHKDTFDKYTYLESWRAQNMFDASTVPVQTDNKLTSLLDPRWIFRTLDQQRIELAGLTAVLDSRQYNPDILRLLAASRGIENLTRKLEESESWNVTRVRELNSDTHTAVPLVCISYAKQPKKEEKAFSRFYPQFPFIVTYTSPEQVTATQYLATCRDRLSTDNVKFMPYYKVKVKQKVTTAHWEDSGKAVPITRIDSAGEVKKIYKKWHRHTVSPSYTVDPSLWQMSKTASPYRYPFTRFIENLMQRPLDSVSSTYYSHDPEKTKFALTKFHSDSTYWLRRFQQATLAWLRDIDYTKPEACQEYSGNLQTVLMGFLWVSRIYTQTQQQHTHLAVTKQREKTFEAIQRALKTKAPEEIDILISKKTIALQVATDAKMTGSWKYGVASLDSDVDIRATLSVSNSNEPSTIPANVDVTTLLDKYVDDATSRWSEKISKLHTLGDGSGVQHALKLIRNEHFSSGPYQHLQVLSNCESLSYLDEHEPVAVDISLQVDLSGVKCEIDADQRALCEEFHKYMESANDQLALLPLAKEATIKSAHSKTGQSVPEKCVVIQCKPSARMTENDNSEIKAILDGIISQGSRSDYVLEPLTAKTYSNDGSRRLRLKKGDGLAVNISLVLLDVNEKPMQSSSSSISYEDTHKRLYDDMDLHTKHALVLYMSALGAWYKNLGLGSKVEKTSLHRLLFLACMDGQPIDTHDRFIATVQKVQSIVNKIGKKMDKRIDKSSKVEFETTMPIETKKLILPGKDTKKYGTISVQQHQIFTTRHKVSVCATVELLAEGGSVTTKYNIPIDLWNQYSKVLEKVIQTKFVPLPKVNREKKHEDSGSTEDTNTEMPKMMALQTWCKMCMDILRKVCDWFLWDGKSAQYIYEGLAKLSTLPDRSHASSCQFDYLDEQVVLATQWISTAITVYYVGTAFPIGEGGQREEVKLSRVYAAPNGLHNCIELVVDPESSTIDALAALETQLENAVRDGLWSEFTEQPKPDGLWSKCKEQTKHTNKKNCLPLRVTCELAGPKEQQRRRMPTWTTAMLCMWCNNTYSWFHHPFNYPGQRMDQEMNNGLGTRPLSKGIYKAPAELTKPEHAGVLCMLVPMMMSPPTETGGKMFVLDGSEKDEVDRPIVTDIASVLVPYAGKKKGEYSEVAVWQKEMNALNVLLTLDMLIKKLWDGKFKKQDNLDTLLNIVNHSINKDSQRINQNDLKTSIETILHHFLEACAEEGLCKWAR